MIIVLLSLLLLLISLLSSLFLSGPRAPRGGAPARSAAHRRRARRRARRVHAECRPGRAVRAPPPAGDQGFQGYGCIHSSNPTPCSSHVFVCVVFSCLAILRIEGCLKSALQHYSWNPLGDGARGRAGQGRRGRRRPRAAPARRGDARGDDPTPIFSPSHPIFSPSHPLSPHHYYYYCCYC